MIHYRKFRYAIRLNTALACMIFLSGCSPEASSQTGAYEINESGGRVFLTKKIDGKRSEVVVGEQIVGIGRKGSYLVIKRDRLEAYDCLNKSGSREIVTVNPNVTEYWIINTDNLEEIGPMEYASYVEAEKNIIGERVNITSEYMNNFAATSDELESMTECKKIS